MVQIINRKKTTLGAINEGMIYGPIRPYLGMSILGEKCERYLWYTFRWCYREYIPPRMRRLFNRGHIEERRIIGYLEEKGIHTHSTQLEAVDIHGHCKGHIDGICEGVIEAPKTPHLGEFKTMSEKYFKEVKRDGVKKSKPTYYVQAQTYMFKFKLKRCLFVAVNKNDDDWYIERLRLDENIGIKAIQRGESVILSERPPRKRFTPTWFECRFCAAKEICHNNHQWDKNCRTCVHCDMLPKGKWECNKHSIGLSIAQQRLACKKYDSLQLALSEG